jgi:hypothetical protein
MAIDWTLSEGDEDEIGKYRKNSRLFVAVQLCSIRLYGRFLREVNDLPFCAFLLFFFILIVLSSTMKVIR